MSNPNSDLRKRTYVEYQKELEAMEKAKFKARAFNKQKFEKKRVLKDERKSTSSRV